MVLTRTEHIGIIACPGAERFTDDVISYLHSIYIKRYNKAVDSICRRYSMQREDLVRQINLTAELTSHRQPYLDDIMHFRIPQYQIPARNTRFVNGELKVEILKSITLMIIC